MASGHRARLPAIVDCCLPLRGRLRAWRVSLDRDPWQASDAAGRWSRARDAMVYASTSAALACLEALAHLEPDKARRRHRIAWFETPVHAGELACLSLDVLPPDWKRRKALTREIGARWLEEGRTLGLLVPSALAPGELNLLLNPAHRRWPQWKRRSCAAPFRFDARLT